MPQPVPPHVPAGLSDSDPVLHLADRLRRDGAGGEFDMRRPVRLSRAPGRLDVMGGIADYTGSLVCEATLDRAAAVALQQRDDRAVRVLSLNLLDSGQAGRFSTSLEDLASAGSAEELRGRLFCGADRWAGYVAGCLYILHEKGLVDLRAVGGGLSMAVLSTVPLGAGVSSSAALEVAAMVGLLDHFGLRALRGKPDRGAGVCDPLAVAAMCQEVENRVVGAPCGIMDQVTSLCGEAGCLLRLLCQPHELLAALRLPVGIRAAGVNSNVRHSVGGGMYGRTRCAAFMAHAMILREMRRAAGDAALNDPMRGYLANLDPDEYRLRFRPRLPVSMKGRDFIAQYGATIDRATVVEGETDYHVRQAADHHVLEAERVRRFVKLIEEAAAMPADDPARGPSLWQAGRLMYESHESYGRCALLGAAETDLLVELLRARQEAGIYGAKITGGGSGGTVAVLADASPRAEQAVRSAMEEYRRRTGLAPEAFMGSSAGAWTTGTKVITPA